MSDSGNDDYSVRENLPPEIIAGVLSRLPVKSLCRFRCVSSPWNSLITSPHFSKTHLNRTHTSNPKHFLRNILLQSMPLDITKEVYTVNLTDDVPFATKLDVASFRPPEDKSVDILGSWNGLLLFSRMRTKNFFLLSPSTRECKKLPRLPCVAGSFPRFYPYLYGGGYDSSMDDYKVVVIFFYGKVFDSDSESESDLESESESDALSEPATVCVYSLKTNAWRRIQDSQHVHGGLPFGVYFNGCLHWDCWKDGSYLVVAFDLADEVFREVPLPPASWVDDKPYELLVLGDCLCLVFISVRNRQIEIWMMKEYGVRASWTKTVIKIMPDIVCIRQLDLLGLLAENEFVLNARVGTPSGVTEDKLFVYNHQTEMLRHIVVRGIPTEFTIWGTYVESLLPRLS